MHNLGWTYIHFGIFSERTIIHEQKWINDSHTPQHKWFLNYKDENKTRISVSNSIGVMSFLQSSNINGINNTLLRNTLRRNEHVIYKSWQW